MEQNSNDIMEITVSELSNKLKHNDSIEIIDVREPAEYEICHLEEATLIPLGELEENLADLDKDKQYVIHCKMGGRSAKAVELMQEYGFKNVVNLNGGITAWAEQIDQSMPVY